MMKSKERKLPGYAHIQQFHNQHHHPETEYDRTPWWEMEDAPREARASGGSVVSQLRHRGGNPNGLMRLHPAMNIPGVHIRSAEAGDPIFRGDK